MPPVPSMPVAAEGYVGRTVPAGLPSTAPGAKPPRWAWWWPRKGRCGFSRPYAPPVLLLGRSATVRLVMTYQQYRQYRQVKPRKAVVPADSWLTGARPVCKVGQTSKWGHRWVHAAQTRGRGRVRPCAHTHSPFQPPLPHPITHARTGHAKLKSSLP